MTYMIANPTAKLGDVAAEFGVSQPWLSCIIHSHAFKTKLRERQELLFGGLAATITEKLESLTHIALDNLTEHVAASNASPATSLEVAKLALHSLGYSPKTGPSASTMNNTQVNFISVSPADLAEARAVMQAAHLPQPALLESESSDLQSQQRDLGDLLADPAPVSSGV